MKKLLALILALCMMLILCACGANDTKTDNTDNKVQSSQTETSSVEKTKSKFQVTVTDQNGNAVKGVMVQICKDSCVPSVTDDNGVATFNIVITNGYKLSVMSCPDGYEYTGEENIYLEDGDTEYSLQITAKEEA